MPGGGLHWLGAKCTCEHCSACLTWFTSNGLLLCAQGAVLLHVRRPVTCSAAEAEGGCNPCERQWVSSGTWSGAELGGRLSVGRWHTAGVASLCRGASLPSMRGQALLCLSSVAARGLRCWAVCCCIQTSTGTFCRWLRQPSGCSGH